MRKVLKLFCSMDVPLKRDIAAQSLADTVLLVKHQKLRGGLCRHKEQNVTNRTTTTPCARIAPMERVIRKDGHFVNIICVCPFLGWDGQCEFCGWKFGGPSAKQFWIVTTRDRREISAWRKFDPKKLNSKTELFRFSFLYFILLLFLLLHWTRVATLVLGPVNYRFHLPTRSALVTGPWRLSRRFGSAGSPKSSNSKWRTVRRCGTVAVICVISLLSSEFP